MGERGRKREERKEGRKNSVIYSGLWTIISISVFSDALSNAYPAK